MLLYTNCHGSSESDLYCLAFISLICSIMTRPTSTFFGPVRLRDVCEEAVPVIKLYDVGYSVHRWPVIFLEVKMVVLGYSGHDVQQPLAVGRLSVQMVHQPFEKWPLLFNNIVVVSLKKLDQLCLDF